MRLFVALSLIATGPLANAAVDEDMLIELREQIEVLSNRLAVLEAQAVAKDEAIASLQVAGEQTAVAVAKIGDPVASNSWADNIKLKGDFRYRHETIDEDGRDQRTRHRIRARIGVTGRVREDLSIGVQLASGSADPTSSNQSLDGGASSKSFNLDRAFFDWEARDGLHIIGGKMANPLFRPGKSALLWDDDLSPEGLALTWDGDRFFLNLLGAWLEERSSDDDSFLMAAQAGWKTGFANGARLTLGGGLLEFEDLRGRSPLFDGSARGNSLDATGGYLYGFSETNLFAEYAFTVSGVPASLFADFVRNSDAGAFDTGFSVGAKLGKASDPGSWEAAWIYRDLQADSHVALFADSDFAGGGTDGTGHIFKAAYAVSKKWTLNLAYLVNERGADAGAERDYNRLQADIKFKY
jgi:hypothetical protein